jgi:hypothetical protein
MAVLPHHQDGRVIEFDLHGLAGLRLINAVPAEIAAVTKQLGLAAGILGPKPDITIRFSERPLALSPLGYLGSADAAFTNDGFFLANGKKGRLFTRIPFETIGKQCEIVCERGVPAVPLLVPILNLALLAKGVLPLHASAFIYRGAGIVVTGWAHGSKTGTLLAFMANGANFIGDDWVYIHDNGRTISGLPQPIQVRDWYLRQLPQCRARLRAIGHRARPGIRWMRAAALTARKWVIPEAMGTKAMERLMGKLEDLLTVHVHPRELFGQEACRSAGFLDKVFVVVTQDRPDVIVRRVDAEDVAGRLAFMLQHERASLLSYYQKFRFAFPEASNPILEQAADIERELLSRALAGKVVYLVLHPYPVRPSALFEALHPIVGCPGGPSSSSNGSNHAAVLEGVGGN